MRFLPSAASRLLIVGLAASLAACSDDSTGPSAPSIAPAVAPNAAVTGSGTGPITTQMNASMCLDVFGAGESSGGDVVLWECHGGANQQWTPTADGELRIYNGTKCLDASTGHGNDGDKLIIWDCHGGANQKWVTTGAGELRGINGKCIDLWGENVQNGTMVALYRCHDGPNQRWNSPSLGSAPALAPAPSDAAAKIFAVMGAVPSVAAVESMGGPFARYEQEFRSQNEVRWNADGSYYDPANYYDRAAIYYVWYARTGNRTYLDRANALAVDYRQNYLEARGYPLDPWWLMLDGVALHALVTGDAASLAALGQMADRLASSGYVNDIGNINGDGESRNQARVLTAFVLAWYAKAPSQAGHDWAGRSRDALTKILSTQGHDGAYRFRTQCGHNKAWMVGLLNDAMVRYYTLFERDGRILPSVKRAVDYMWANDWDENAQAFYYMSGSCDGSGIGGAPDLNNLIANGFGFVYQQTGDASYRQRGDVIFEAGVYRGWLATAKHFNQAYTTSYRYLALRR